MKMVLESKAISTEPIKKKLKSLREYMPDQKDIVYDFATYLADRLYPKLVPEGFSTIAELALYDLQKGINGFTGQPIKSSLVGYPSMVYRLLRIQVPKIADAVCPEEFAQGVRKMYDIIREGKD